MEHGGGTGGGGGVGPDWSVQGRDAGQLEGGGYDGGELGRGGGTGVGRSLLEWSDAVTNTGKYLHT